MSQKKLDIELAAYQIYDHPLLNNFRIEAASKFRSWMDESPDRFAYRCLPLVIANQAGWVITCPTSFTVSWTGGLSLDSVVVRFDEPEQTDFWRSWIGSHFGNGIVTFSIPYIFRTSDGFGLSVRGPTNLIKPGIVGLDGFIETDWHDFTFTMNWKLTDPGRAIRFEVGEPIAMIQPTSISQIEAVKVALLPISINPELAAAYEKKRDSRNAFNARTDRGKEWQRDYFAGRKADLSTTPVHYSKIRLAEFTSNAPQAEDVR
jgi:hypothetical protein